MKIVGTTDNPSDYLTCPGSGFCCHRYGNLVTVNGMESGSKKWDG